MPTSVINKIWTCRSCSHRWLGPASTCPHCGSVGKSEPEAEFTKKIVDDNDLMKAN